MRVPQQLYPVHVNGNTLAWPNSDDSSSSEWSEETSSEEEEETNAQETNQQPFHFIIGGRQGGVSLGFRPCSGENTRTIHSLTFGTNK